MIANSKDITLVDADTGEKLEEQLPSLLASALSQNYINIDKVKVLSATDVACKAVAPSRVSVVGSYKCNVTLLDGDFERSSNGLIGPDTESSQSFKLDVIRKLTPDAKPVITSKVVKVIRAG